jgi:hypothetical protein
MHCPDDAGLKIQIYTGVFGFGGRYRPPGLSIECQHGQKLTRISIKNIELKSVRAPDHRGDPGYTWNPRGGGPRSATVRKLDARVMIAARMAAV